jgi:hypothetical protein
MTLVMRRQVSQASICGFQSFKQSHVRGGRHGPSAAKAIFVTTIPTFDDQNNAVRTCYLTSLQLLFTMSKGNSSRDSTQQTHTSSRGTARESSVCGF